VKRRQEAQQTELEILKFLVNYVVTDDELKHLRHFLSNEPWPFDKTATGTEKTFLGAPPKIAQKAKNTIKRLGDKLSAGPRASKEPSVAQFVIETFESVFRF
jgi:hypothetical protein